MRSGMVYKPAVEPSTSLFSSPTSLLRSPQPWRSGRRPRGRLSLQPAAQAASQQQTWKTANAAPRGASTVGRAATLTAEAAKVSSTAQFSSFEDMVRASPHPVLVDFYAQWCGPCKLMGSMLTGVADELKGKVSVVKIDTDKYPSIASRYGIKALPTLLLFRDGKAVDRIEGIMPEASLMQRLRFYIGRLDLKFGRR